MAKKQIPTGIEKFDTLIKEDFYYVDKTDIIDTMLNNKKFVYLFPRPRRFGKSIFISMLDNFFNIEYKEKNKDLFNGLKIEKSKHYDKLSSTPVISVDFKEITGNNYDEMYDKYKLIIKLLYGTKRYVLGKLEDDEKNTFNSLLNGNANLAEYKSAIKLLSGYMYKYYNKEVIILIDEYDAPIQDAYIKGFYSDFISLIKDVFSSALKGNQYVDFSVMTGVLRVSKESLFSDLNNVTVYGIVNNKYRESFGFTSKETKALLEYYDLKLSDDVKKMYDGYNFNNISIYNPWSILNYADNKELIPYWVNTSGNELIIKTIKGISNKEDKNNIDTDTDNIKIVIEKLLSGESIAFRYNDKITYLDYNQIHSKNTVLNLLLTSGYLTLGQSSIDNFGNKVTTVKLPNDEVKELFKTIILEILTEDNHIEKDYIDGLCNGILDNDKTLMENSLNKMLPNMSYMDESEKFYHGYMLGLFTSFMNEYFTVKSNREAGSGRFDLMIEKNDKSLGMILELKITDNEDKMESVAKEALNQIETKEYYEVLVSDKVKTIYKYAIIFKGKKCIVR